MSLARWLAPHWRNRLQSLLLLGAMGLIWALLGWTLAGPEWMIILLGVGLASVLVGLPASSRLILALYQARPLPQSQAPELHALVAELGRRARLSRMPTLYVVPSRLLNAFTVGSRDDAAVAVTDGLLRTMPWRELAGVLAHEMSHLRHNDMWVMALADLVSRMTHLLSLVGQLLLLVNLPLILFTDLQVPWLALSRQREYDADLGAARLTGDPQGLASALVHLERLQGTWLTQVLLPGRQVPDPSLLRSHPPTEERVRRLLELAASGEAARWADAAGAPLDALQDHDAARHPPRWRVSGTWY